MLPALTEGDRIRLREIGQSRWVNGVVILASGGGRSILVDTAGKGVRAGEGVSVGLILLTVDYAAETVMGLTGHWYEIEMQETD